MTRQEPGDGHVALTDYERRQLELIEARLAAEAPAHNTCHDRSALAMSESMWLWLTIYWTWIILGGWFHMLARRRAAR